MGSGADSTKENWEALRRLTSAFLARLRARCPSWTLADVRRHLDLPDTRLFADIAREAGFGARDALSSDEETQILQAMFAGVTDPSDIARQTRVPLAKVQEFLEEVGVPYGAGGYGAFAWSGGREADAKASSVECRRVSSKGQFSYEGQVYSLGSDYGGRPCWVRDMGDLLLIYCPGRSRLTLRKR